MARLFHKQLDKLKLAFLAFSLTLVSVAVLFPLRASAWTAITLPHICSYIPPHDVQERIKTVHPWFDLETSSYVYGRNSTSGWNIFYNDGRYPITFEYYNSAYYASLTYSTDHPAYEYYIQNSDGALYLQGTYTGNLNTNYGAIAARFTSTSCIKYASNVYYDDAWNTPVDLPEYPFYEVLSSGSGGEPQDLSPRDLKLIAVAITGVVGFLIIRSFRWGIYE